MTFENRHSKFAYYLLTRFRRRGAALDGVDDCRLPGAGGGLRRAGGRLRRAGASFGAACAQATTAAPLLSVCHKTQSTTFEDFTSSSSKGAAHGRW